MNTSLPFNGFDSFYRTLTAPSLGPARLRRARRAARREAWKGEILRSLWLSRIALLLVLPLIALAKPSAGSEPTVGSSSPVVQSEQRPGGMAQALMAIPVQNTATPTPGPTQTPTLTATPLPPALIQATAWQATVEAEVSASYVTQTAVWNNYSATQTALPPIITAKASERAAEKTAVVATAHATKKR